MITHRVYRSLNKPLTICGVERRLFFVALVVGAATFNFFGSLLGALLMFASLYALAKIATHRDPELLRILVNSGRVRPHYDPAKPDAPRLLQGGGRS
jgi:type IV secretory pathway TrbD component